MPSAEPSLIRKHLRGSGTKWAFPGAQCGTLWLTREFHHSAELRLGLPGLHVTPEQRATHVSACLHTTYVSLIPEAFPSHSSGHKFFFLHQLAWLLDMAMEPTGPREKHTAMTKVSSNSSDPEEVERCSAHRAPGFPG